MGEQFTPMACEIAAQVRQEPQPSANTRGVVAEAAYCPPDLIVEILSGMRDDADSAFAMAQQEGQDARIASIAQSGFNSPSPKPAHHQRENAQATAQGAEQTKSQFQLLDGKCVDIRWSFKPSYSDEYM